MLLSADAVDSETTIEADLCIVGAGAAGITLALQFINTSTRICLLESGGFDLDSDTQGLYEGDVADDRSPPLTFNRLRFFGGTTNHWSGTSRPLDPLDFEERPYVPNSGWPFRFETLAPYYERAARVLQIKAPFEGADTGEYEPLKLDTPWIEPGHFYRLNPLRFGEVYRDDITSAPNVTTLLNANVVDIETTENAAEVTRLRVATLGGRRFWVKGRAYVLAAGGLENPRLLLNATSVERAGLGNRYDNVGRYFHDHPNVVDSAKIVFTSFDPAVFFYLHRVDENGVGQRGVFWPTEAAQRRWEMLNCALWLAPVEIIQASPGVASLRHIFENLGHVRMPNEFGRHVTQVVTDIDGIFAAVFRRVFHGGPVTFSAWYWSECPPDPESRVTLTDERDALGLRRLRVDWRIPETYTRTYIRMHELLGQALGASGAGRLQVQYVGPDDDPRRHTNSSAHHMGTTRMHVDPRKGVVDADCRVHGIANLYIAGSSVFPNYGQSAATYTIAALALRLADHLKQISV